MRPPPCSRSCSQRAPALAALEALTELRWLYERRNIDEAHHDLAAWLQKWQGQRAKRCDWVEGNIDETLTFYRFPSAHPKHLRSTNMLERPNEELKRRTHVVHILPNEATCLRLVRAPAATLRQKRDASPRHQRHGDRPGEAAPETRAVSTDQYPG